MSEISNNKKFISDYLSFLNASPTPYHATIECIKILKESNFIQIHENDYISYLENIKPGRYFITFNSTFLFAFVIPNIILNKKQKTHPESKIEFDTIKDNQDSKELEYSFRIVATHNDSPCLKIKPRSLTALKASAYLENKTNTNPTISTIRLSGYGGGIWHTWFDRPLGVAGIYIDKNLNQNTVLDNSPLLYIPSLAIHLDNGCEIYGNGFKYDKEEQLNAIWTRTDKNIDTIKEYDCKNSSSGEKNKNRVKNFSFSEFISKYDDNNVLSYDFSLFDIQKAILGGNQDNLIFSGRHDNLLSTFCGLKAITSNQSKEEKNQKHNKNNEREIQKINIFALFDHEEIGSLSTQGAYTATFTTFISKLKEKYKINNKKSIIVSADVGHGYNPNYSYKYEQNHQPILGNGVVIKYSPYYATNTFTSAIIKKIVIKDGNLKFQEFCLKNTSRGGSTIGPMLCAGTGIQGVDIGVPVLGMHSIKEVAHVDDIWEQYRLFFNIYDSDIFD